MLEITLHDQITALSLNDLEELYLWMEGLIRDRKIELALSRIPSQKGREVIETRRAGKITYQLEKVKCGKKKCKCNKGKLHGPYWYAYNWNGKKLSSTYVGKKLKDIGGQAASASHTEEVGSLTDASIP